PRLSDLSAYSPENPTTTCKGRGRSAELRSAPRLGELRRQPFAQPLSGDPLLLEAVAIAQRDGPVLHGLPVDGDPPGGSDLVLTAVALADRPALVVLGGHVRAHVGVDLAG